MKPNKIYITTLLLLFFLSGRAQKIEELTAVPLQIGCEKTLHDLPYRGEVLQHRGGLCHR